MRLAKTFDVGPGTDACRSYLCKCPLRAVLRVAYAAGYDQAGYNGPDGTEHVSVSVRNSTRRIAEGDWTKSRGEGDDVQIFVRFRSKREEVETRRKF